MRSSTFYSQTLDQPWAQDEVNVEIGDGRSIQVTANKNGITLSKEQIRPGKSIADNTVTLDAGACRILNSFFDDLRRAASLCKHGELQEDFFLPLGARLFAQVKTDVRCVSFRKFFRPKHNKELLLPGYPGVAMKLKEFETFDSEFRELIECVQYETAPVCSFKDPKDHTECKFCFFY